MGIVSHNWGKLEYQIKDKSLIIKDFYAEKETERLLFFRLLILGIEGNYADIQFFPRDYIERGLFKKWGFIVKNSDGFDEHLIFYIRKPLLFYCADGGRNKYGAIAANLGWYCGMQSDSLRNIYDAWMIDNDWKNYNHNKHLEMTKRNKPLIATARDIENSSQLLEILEQAEELNQHCGKVIIIPKCKVEIPTRYWLGFSVPTSHGHTNINPEWFNTHYVHLLGGSPKNQVKYSKYFSKLTSLDGNYAALAARFCKSALINGSKQISGGCYKAFEHSLLSQRKYWWGI